MADLAVTTVTEAGVLDSLSAAAGGGDAIPGNNGDIILAVNNGGGGSITVTITAQQTGAQAPGMGQLTKANGGGSVTNGTRRLFGPFPPLAFNDTNGKVQITYSGVTSVTVGAYRVPRS